MHFLRSQELFFLSSLESQPAPKGSDIPEYSMTLYLLACHLKMWLQLRLSVWDVITIATALFVLMVSVFCVINSHCIRHGL